MSVVKKQTVTKAWLNSAANANTLRPGDFYVVDRDGTYQATSGSSFVKQTEAQPLPDFGSAAFAEVEDFATKAQGDKADTALQSGDLKTVNGQSVVGEGDIVISSEAKLWVSGTEYAAGQFVISPLSSHQYMRRTSGAGTTDPATDKTNWRMIGSGGIKSIQRGVVSIPANAASVNVTVSSVDASKSSLCLLGWTSPVSTAFAAVYIPKLVLANATTVTASRGSAQPSACDVSWELIEYWS